VTSIEHKHTLSVVIKLTVAAEKKEFYIASKHPVMFCQLKNLESFPIITEENFNLQGHSGH